MDNICQKSRKRPSDVLTYIKVRTKYLSPETLNHYRLPWEYDPDNEDFIIIEKFISPEFQEELFDHTERLRRSIRRPPEVKPDPGPALMSLYMAPEDRFCNNLSWKVNTKATEASSEPNLSTRRTKDLATKDNQLRNRLNLHSLLKAGVMTAHRSSDDDDTNGIVVEYVDSLECPSNLQFRWT